MGLSIPRRSRRRGVTVGLPLLGLALLSPASSVLSGAGDLDSSATQCKQLPMVRVVALRADGSEQAPSSGDGLGRRYYFALDSGTVTQVVPPPEFVPTKASDSELETYGIPMRPADATARAQWFQDWSAWQRSDAVGLCQSEFSN
jgi:hypothetical protein